jgi:membrane protein
MHASDNAPGGSKAEQAAQTRGTAGSKQPGGKIVDRPGLRHARRAAEWGKKKYAGSWAAYLWQRLDAADFLNQAMLLAATLLLCAVPFVLIMVAVAGRSIVPELSWRLGLTKQAAADVGHLFTSSAATSAAVTGLSWVFFILAGIAMATAIQRVYQRVFEQDPRGARDRLPALIWLALLVGWMLGSGWIGPGLRASGPVAFWIVNIAAYIGFWWFTMWFLLAGQVSWRRLYPCAVATGAFWMGMLAVFDAIFSGMVISYDQKYGAIGIVFAFMSFFIAIGVVLIVGAAVGLMWQDRGLSFRAAVGNCGGHHDRSHQRGTTRPTRGAALTRPDRVDGAAGRRLGDRAGDRVLPAVAGPLLHPGRGYDPGNRPGRRWPARSRGRGPARRGGTVAEPPQPSSA